MEPALAIWIEVQVVSSTKAPSCPGTLRPRNLGKPDSAGTLVLQVYRLCRPLSRHGTAINMVSGSQVKAVTKVPETSWPKYRLGPLRPR